MIKEKLKIYSSYKTIEEALERKDKVIETVINSINRSNESSKDYKLSYIDNQIMSTKNNEYKLMIILNKETI